MLQSIASTVFLFAAAIGYTDLPGATLGLVAKTGEDYRYQTLSTQGLTAANITFTLSVQGNVTGYIQYIDAYFDGKVTYNDSKTASTDNFVDSSNDINSFKWFLLDPSHNLTVTAVANNNTDSRWMSTSSYTITADMDSTACPHAKNDTSEPIEVNSTFLLFSDYYRENEGTRNYAKRCVWTLKAPPSGSVLAINLLNYTMEQNEKLQIAGSYVFRTYDSQLLEPLGVRYYNSVVVITYDRPTAVKAAIPAFRMLVEMMKTQTKNCSLEYNGHKYKNFTGSFTNIRPYYTYNKYELCVWTVDIPANSTFDFCYIKSNFGRFSGDELSVRTLEKTYHNYLSDVCFHREANDTDYEANFIWESDGLHEFNGFLLNYTITDIYAVETTTKQGTSTSICFVIQILALCIAFLRNMPF